MTVLALKGQTLLLPRTAGPTSKLETAANRVGLEVTLLLRVVRTSY